jgi:hypothetical protein
LRDSQPTSADAEGLVVLRTDDIVVDELESDNKGQIEDDEIDLAEWRYDDPK